MSIPAQLKYIVLSLLFLLSAYNFSKTTLSIIQSSKRLEELQGEVVALETQKSSLKSELEYRKTAEFIEEEARNKLNMVKPGEEVYAMVEAETSVLGEDSIIKTHSNTATEDGASNKQLNSSSEWLNLFF